MQESKAERNSQQRSQKLWGEESRLLCFAEERPHWVNLTLQLDGRGCHSPRLDWVSTEAELIALVHEHQFDVIVIALPRLNHFDSQVAAVLQIIRTSGNHDPVLILAEQCDPRTLAQCYDADVEFLHSSLYWDAPALLSALERARRRHAQQEEHRTWSRERQQRLVQEQRESERILDQQRKMLHDLRSLACPPELNLEGPSAHDQPDQQTLLNDLKTYYAALLKSYVVMGTGSLSEEIQQVVFQMEVCGLTIRETMALHLEQVEELVRGLGNRSSRHVMSRADVLILELLIHLAESRL